MKPNEYIYTFPIFFTGNDKETKYERDWTIRRLTLELLTSSERFIWCLQPLYFNFILVIYLDLRFKLFAFNLFGIMHQILMILHFKQHLIFMQYNCVIMIISWLCICKKHLFSFCCNVLIQWPIMMFATIIHSLLVRIKMI